MSNHLGLRGTQGSLPGSGCIWKMNGNEIGIKGRERGGGGKCVPCKRITEVCRERDEAGV